MATATRGDGEGDTKKQKTEKDTKIPVTVITGFLGSGKTTLLNHILTKNHGKKIAVIENEFGEIGIDDALVKKKFDTNEEIFEMNNGCICCTVRGDLVRILGKLIARPDRLDGVIIETTGMADPAPVAQTFFMDPAIEKNCQLDAIVTVVDACHIIQHLDEEKPEGAENEAVEQIVFADRAGRVKREIGAQMGKIYENIKWRAARALLRLAVDIGEHGGFRVDIDHFHLIDDPIAAAEHAGTLRGRSILLCWGKFFRCHGKG